MRTTISLDDDVSVQLKRELKSGRSFKEIVNDALRRGLAQFESERVSDCRVVYQIKPFDSGKCLVNDLDSISEAIANVEGEKFK